ncbi:GyrI-like domain-containing protein [bacterium]|nr:GyrI-like domain-containing protein [bacterium]
MSAIKIVELPPQKAAYFRSTKGYEQEGIHGAFDRLNKHLSKNPPGESLEVLGLGWDDPESTPLDKCRYDAAFTFTGETPAGTDGTHELPGGTFAHYRYVGPYDKMGEAFKEAHQLIAEDTTIKLRSDVCIDNYRNDPASTPPEELITDIYLPVKKV